MNLPESFEAYRDHVTAGGQQLRVQRLPQPLPPSFSLTFWPLPTRLTSTRPCRQRHDRGGGGRREEERVRSIFWVAQDYISMTHAARVVHALLSSRRRSHCSLIVAIVVDVHTSRSHSRRPGKAPAIVDLRTQHVAYDCRYDGA